jgi:uncharacterized protein YaiI (UPF0178 family)
VHDLGKVMATIYIDADGCPVKNETYKVARRYQLAVRDFISATTPWTGRR